MVRCKAICASHGKQCTHEALIDGLCTKHYCCREGLESQQKTYKIDMTIHLWKEK